MCVPSFPTPILTCAFSFADSYSLRYNFTINPKAGLGHPWCEVQGQIHGNMFLYYRCGSRKAKLFGPLGMKVNSTKTWERQMETLNYLMEELKKKLLDVKAGIFTKNGMCHSLRQEFPSWLSG